MLGTDAHTHTHSRDATWQRKKKSYIKWTQSWVIFLSASAPPLARSLFFVLRNTSKSEPKSLLGGLVRCIDCVLPPGSSLLCSHVSQLEIRSSVMASLAHHSTTTTATAPLMMMLPLANSLIYFSISFFSSCSLSGLVAVRIQRMNEISETLLPDYAAGTQPNKGPDDE